MQARMVDGIVRIGEADPPTTVTFTPTVPITCPPCRLTVFLVSYIGLKISRCNVTFLASDPVMASQNITVEAVKTPGSFSRVTRITYSVTMPQQPGSCWDNYKLTYTPVCLQHYMIVLMCVVALLYTSHICRPLEKLK